MSVRKRIPAYFLIVIGLAMLAGGTYFATDSEVKCDGKVMTQGDLCIYYDKNDKRTENSYDEEKASGHRQGLFILGGGVLMIAYAVGSLVIASRKEKAAAQTSTAAQDWQAPAQ